jgi:polygalacturonase
MIRKQLLILTFTFLAFFVVGANEFVLYEAPPNTPSAPDFEVYINGQKAFVYNTRPAAFLNFSFNGKIEVRVICPGPIYAHDIRPHSKGLVSTQYRNEIRFSLTEPTNISIEVNKNIKRPLFLFANPLEKDVPKKGAANVLFFEKGKTHTPGIVKVSSNQTVYIEGGAVVKGSFIAEGKNIRFLGRGILDNSHYGRGEARPIEINQCENVLLDGFVIAESKHWTCGSFASTNITYRNLKIVSDNDWDDGIDIVGSKKVVVDNCFIRTKDDCVAIKSGVNYFTRFESGFTVDEVVIKNSVLWNGIWGNGLEIGFETRTDTIQNILFQNCDIIHTEGPEGTFTIHNGDKAFIRNVRYEGIRVEDAQGYLIDLKILDSRYTKDKQKGYIDGVYFKDITVEGDIFPTSLIMGFDEQHRITNVTIDNVYIHGKKLKSTYDGMLTLIHTENITFK